MALLTPQRGRATWSPEQELWGAVLFHGIRAAVLGSESDIRWVKSGEVWIGSFEWVIEILSLETEKPKMRAIALRKDEGYKRFLKSRFGRVLNTGTKYARKYYGVRNAA